MSRLFERGGSIDLSSRSAPDYSGENPVDLMIHLEGGATDEDMKRLRAREAKRLKAGEDPSPFPQTEG